MSRRRFGAVALASATSETAFAQHAAVQGAVPADTVWLNANEKQRKRSRARSAKRDGITIAHFRHCTKRWRIWQASEPTK